jgi:hypothetical protein
MALQSLRTVDENNLNGYFVHNADSSVGTIYLLRGDDCGKFLARWGGVAWERRDRAQVCEWCDSVELDYYFKDLIFR